MSKKIVTIVVGVSMLAPLLALAQGIPLPTPSGGVNIGSVGQFGSIMQNLARLFGSIIMAISVFILLYAGWLFLTAGDNEEAVTSARSYITYGVIGLIVALVSFSIPALVASLLGGTVLQ